ncbi:hypoxanthine phosphoribosyltransferase [Flavobacteriaceae bacterium UJ101]|nr:hypoxanthine phosphoribosyltransferase [Flavobacteriaceae bacterium UJ101]
MKEIQIHDKTFVPYISRNEIQATIRKIGQELSEEFKGKQPVFIGVLNGVVLMMGDLLKNFDGECEMSFIRLASYEGTESTGEVKTMIDFQEDFSGKDIILVEDIVDTGNTLKKLYEMVSQQDISSCTIVSLFLKPDVYKKDLKIHKVGMEIPNKFVVGYGLDYDGLGRNLPDIYQLKQ